MSSNDFLKDNRKYLECDDNRINIWNDKDKTSLFISYDSTLDKNDNLKTIVLCDIKLL